MWASRPSCLNVDKALKIVLDTLDINAMVSFSINKICLVFSWSHNLGTCTVMQPTTPSNRTITKNDISNTFDFISVSWYSKISIFISTMNVSTYSLTKNFVPPCFMQVDLRMPMTSPTTWRNLLAVKNCKPVVIKQIIHRRGLFSEEDCRKPNQ